MSQEELRKVEEAGKVSDGDAIFFIADKEKRVCGIAPGIDRRIMLISGEPNIRDFMAFPFNQQAQDLMMNVPSEVDPKQLRELRIGIVQPKDKKKE